MKTEHVLMLGALGLLGYLAWTASKKADAALAAPQVGPAQNGAAPVTADQGLFGQLGVLLDEAWSFTQQITQQTKTT